MTCWRVGMLRGGVAAALAAAASAVMPPIGAPAATDRLDPALPEVEAAAGAIGRGTLAPHPVASMASGRSAGDGHA